MDLCRGTQEVEAVLGVENEVSCDPLGRLRLAIQYNEKKVSYQIYRNAMALLLKAYAVRYGPDM